MEEKLKKLIDDINPKFKKRLIDLIGELHIKTADDFLGCSSSKITRFKNCGNIFYLELRRALVLQGLTVDMESIVNIDKKLEKLRCIQKVALLRLRFEVFKKNGFKCIYCGRSPRNDETVILEVDHIHPQAREGDFGIDNLVTSCKECNLGKGDVLLTEYWSKK